MDRTTLGRNVLPLEREGLIEIVPGRTDQRSKELRPSCGEPLRHAAPAPGAPVDVAARHRGVLLEHPFALGKLRRIPRDPAGWRGALHPAPSESWGEMARLRSARVFVSASVV